MSLGYGVEEGLELPARKVCDAVADKRFNLVDNRLADVIVVVVVAIDVVVPAVMFWVGIRARTGSLWAGVGSWCCGGGCSQCLSRAELSVIN